MPSRNEKVADEGRGVKKRRRKFCLSLASETCPERNFGNVTLLEARELPLRPSSKARIAISIEIYVQHLRAELLFNFSVNRLHSPWFLTRVAPFGQMTRKYPYRVEFATNLLTCATFSPMFDVCIAPWKYFADPLSCKEN